MSKEEEDFYKKREEYFRRRHEFGDLTFGKIQKSIKLKEFRELEKLTGTGQQEQFVCSVCRSKGKGHTFERYHFENCKLYGLDLEYIFRVLGSTPREFALKRFNSEGIYLDLGDIKMIISNFPEEIPEKRKYTCPHCNFSGTTSFVKQHYNNCPFKGVDHNELISYFKKIDSPKFCYIRTADKYDIPVHYIKRFIKEKKVPIPKVKPIVKSNFKHGGKYTCYNCKQKGEGPLFGNLHFDNCWITKLSKKQLIQFKLDIGYFSIKEISRMYNLSYVNVKNYYKTHNIKWDLTQTRFCPYCNSKGSGGVWYSNHFGNCVIWKQGIDMKELVMYLKTHSIRLCIEKYGISKSLLVQIRKEN